MGSIWKQIRLKVRGGIMGKKLRFNGVTKGSFKNRAELGDF